jgi:hypothetical protein
MFRDFFDNLKIELAGVVPEVRIGVPREDADLEETTIYITFVNIESIDRQRRVANIKVLITAFIPKTEGDQETNEANEIAAIDAIDEVFMYLEENKRSYTLVATTENLLNNIWSALRVSLRPFLVYECPVKLSTT